MVGVLWLFLFRDGPERCSWISDEERDHIRPQKTLAPDPAGKTKPEKSAVPWSRMLRCGAVWAVFPSVWMQWEGGFYAGAFVPDFLEEVLLPLCYRVVQKRRHLCYFRWAVN